MLEVSKSVEVAASPETVWQAIGQFCGIADWHPAIAGCELSEQDGAPVRTLTLKGGGTIVERQTGRSDSEMRYSYTIVQGPLPVADYHSTISVAPKGGGGAEISWRGTFEAKGAPDAEAMKVIQGIYDSGLEALIAKAKG